MKFTITGSELASHLRPLRPIVRQNDEKDYDNIVLTINREDSGRRSLRAAVLQPTYTVYMCLDLGRDGEQPNENGIGPIDPDAEAAEPDEAWIVPASKLAACNRSLGYATGTYIAEGDTLNISFDNDDTTLHIAGRYAKKALEVPVGNDYPDIPKAAEGTIAANTLQRMLYSALKVCKLGGKSSNLMEQTIHLTIEGKQLTVEALSYTAQYSCIKSDAITPSDPKAPAAAIHLSMSKEAALVLSDIAELTGEEMDFEYDRTLGELCIWCEPYIMCITVQEIGTQTCIPIEKGEYGVTIDTESLIDGVARAKNVGCKTLHLMCHTTGEVRLSTPDDSVSMRLASQVHIPYCSPRTFRLPVNALCAVVGGVRSDVVYMTFDTDQRYVVLEMGDGCKSLIQEV